MDNPAPRDTTKKLPVAVAGLVVIVTILCRTGSTILTPIWIDSLNQDKSDNTSDCNNYTSERHVDPFSMLLIVNVLFTLLFGVIYVCTKIFCSSIITERETGYDKKEFAAVGLCETLAGMFILLSSSGCRTAPYLQSLAANFTIPVTFFLRFLILRKRPTCRKLLCAMLVLVAMFTALMPEIFPDLDSTKAKKEEGGAEGVTGLLWAICNFFGFVPLSICTIIIEKVMKARAHDSRARRGDSSQLNTAYVMFWCYFFALLSQLLLFWMDMIPGFGMTNNIEGLAKMVWFNIKCFFGYAGCRGLVNYVSGPCVVVVMSNRLIQAYFVRYLEGANLMAMILLIPTPLAFIFYTLFDEDPLQWHPHAYLSTWLSIVALCIMIPAIYIYSSGAPEVDYNRPEGNGDDEDDERRPLLGDDHGFPDHGVERYGYNRTSSVATQAGSMVDSGVQTSLPDPCPPSQGFQTYTPDHLPPSQGFQTFKPGQPRQQTNPFVREHRVQSDVSAPRREVQNKYTSKADNGSDGFLNTSMPVAKKVAKQPDTEVSSSWPAPEYSFQGRKERDEEQKPSTKDSGTQDRFGTRDIPMRSPVHDEGFDDRHGPVWTSSDFNVNRVDNQGDYEDRLNPFGTSPYVEIGAGNQNVVKYSDPREPAVQEAEESAMRATDAGHQLIASGSPPSYTSLPKE